MFYSSDPLPDAQPTVSKHITQQIVAIYTQPSAGLRQGVNLNQQSTVKTVHMCVCARAQLPYTIQHRTVLIIFPLILQTVIIAQMLSTGEEA